MTDVSSIGFYTFIRKRKNNLCHHQRLVPKSGECLKYTNSYCEQYIVWDESKVDKKITRKWCVAFILLENFVIETYLIQILMLKIDKTSLFWFIAPISSK